jgi:hypothetical protein
VKREAVHIVVGLLRKLPCSGSSATGSPAGLVFLVFAVIGFAAGIGLASISLKTPAQATVICGIIGAGLAWPLASIPIYYWQHRLRVLLNAQRRRDEEHQTTHTFDPMTGRVVRTR